MTMLIDCPLRKQAVSEFPCSLWRSSASSAREIAVRGLLADVVHERQLFTAMRYLFIGLPLSLLDCNPIVFFSFAFVKGVEEIFSTYFGTPC